MRSAALRHQIAVSGGEPSAADHRRATARSEDCVVRRNGDVVDVKEINKRVVEQFRAGGEIEGMRRERLLLLTTTGARTGRPYTTPMMFHPAGERVMVIASNAGASRHPDWFHNLVANPDVTVEIGDERYAATAAPLTGADRERAWDEIKAAYPFFADHEVKAGREIPVVTLTRQQAAVLPRGEGVACP
jgi:deazaflavin-dependent oxidoreductase (nitroreductase family)